MTESVHSMLFSIIGIIVILGIAFALSSGKRHISLRVVGAAFGLQAFMALLVLRTDVGIEVIKWLSSGVSALLGYGNAGTDFLLGADNPMRNTFAVGALPVIIFFASLVSILYYLGVMQRLVKWVGGAIQFLTGVSKVESLGAAANIFVGQSESPLVVRPYLKDLPASKIFTLMCVGMAGVAGTILALYASILGEAYLPFLLSAAFMSAPGGILMAKIIMPDLPEPEPDDSGVVQAAGARLKQGSTLPAEQARVTMVGKNGEEVELPQPRTGTAGPNVAGGADDDVTMSETFEEGVRPSNIIEAAGQGAMTGVKIAVAVGAMVLSFVALVALANGILGGIGGWFGYPDVTFQQLLGYVFAPVMFLIGISDWDQAQLAGGLFGTKIVTNEVYAFDLLIREGSILTERSRAIVTFALCGFANFSSIAIQMAVFGSLAPEQRPVVARLGLKALAAGSLANLMSAALASLFLPL